MNSTKLLEEVEGAQLGLGIIRSLIGIDADEVQNAAVKAYMDGNMKHWQSRSGLEVTGVPEPEGDDMGHTVSIGNTYNYEGGAPSSAAAAPVAQQPQPVAAATPMSNLTKAGIGAAILGTVLGGTALGVALLRPDAPSGVDRDTSVIISIPPEDRTP